MCVDFADFPPTCVWELDRYVVQVRIPPTHTPLIINKYKLIFIVLSDDHHCYCSLCGQKEQNGAVSRFRQECSLKSKHPHPIIISLFIPFLMYFVIYKSFCLLCPDFPPPFAVRWEPCYRPGKHQKTQVFTSSFASHLVLKFS